ncbi:MAG TPA: 50S ribosomal protein L18 [Halanaerobiaceae bacterium]|jgi:large subunit ribosomal protein L18|nr:50S ribosomal protein L18 [Bacillota bacterium]HHU92619.1 50S ribosomal protein L18 [Halanaerobiaceae bacterium]HOA40499.1 50S ribosomal protein L18 [Halanaerobiales bacterium]HPZ62658.1 50S ribosomal protein L18 [Halanaerobiales bacterium]HQD03512.1 50S ribosomal protein L18 [Halanaerobiales bacterium]
MDNRSRRKRRHHRVRNKVVGTPERPRVNVYRSLNHIYAQIIDDLSGHTLVSASSLEPAVKDAVNFGGNKDAARKVGEVLAEKALEKGIKDVVFDRGGYKYHGRVKELAEALREKGLNF